MGDDLPSWPWLALVPIGIWVMLALAGVLPLVSLLYVAFKPSGADPAGFHAAEQWLGPDWAIRNGFVPADVLQSSFGPIMGYTRPDEPRFIAVYRAGGGVVVDIVTIWRDGVGLTTSITRAGGTLPTPRGSYQQMFPGATADDLWWRHREAEQAIERFEGVTLAESDASLNFATSFQTEVRASAAYVLRRPLLWLTVPWRYFITRRRLPNVPVGEQILRGWHRPKFGGFGPRG